MTTQTTWEHNQQEFELDMQDAETGRRFEEAYSRMKGKADRIRYDGKFHEILSGYCDAMFEFFDVLLGEGTSAALFGEKKNARECTTAYESVLDFISEQSGKDMEQQRFLVQKYSRNRAERRASK